IEVLADLGPAGNGGSALRLAHAVVVVQAADGDRPDDQCEEQGRGAIHARHAGQHEVSEHEPRRPGEEDDRERADPLRQPHRETTNKAKSSQLAPSTTSSARVIPETENSSGASPRLSSLLIFAGTATRDFCASASRMASSYLQATARRSAARRRYAAPWTYCAMTIEPIATLSTARNARALGIKRSIFLRRRESLTARAGWFARSATEVSQVVQNQISTAARKKSWWAQ